MVNYFILNELDTSSNGIDLHPQCVFRTLQPKGFGSLNHIPWTQYLTIMYVELKISWISYHDNKLNPPTPLRASVTSSDELSNWYIEQLRQWQATAGVGLMTYTMGCFMPIVELWLSTNKFIVPQVVKLWAARKPERQCEDVAMATVGIQMRVIAILYKECTMTIPLFVGSCWACRLLKSKHPH